MTTLPKPKPNNKHSATIKTLASGVTGLKSGLPRHLAVPEFRWCELTRRYYADGAHRFELLPHGQRRFGGEPVRDVSR